jgi:putative transposase
LGYRRVNGELLVLGVKVAPATVWEILKTGWDRSGGWAYRQQLGDSLRSQADALLAWDFPETVTLTGTRVYVLAVIEHASRRIRSWASPQPMCYGGRVAVLISVDVSGA